MGIQSLLFSLSLSDENLRSWRSSIGYIPHEVYLFDGTVEDNIVFGREYDSHKLMRSVHIRTRVTRISLMLLLSTTSWRTTSSLCITTRIRKLKNVKKEYGKNQVLFENLSLEIEKGEFVGLVGKSGADVYKRQGVQVQRDTDVCMSHDIL